MTLHYFAGKTDGRLRVMRCGRRIAGGEAKGRATTARGFVTCQRCITLIVKDRAQKKEKR